MSAYLPIVIQLLSIVGVPGLLWLAWTAVAGLKMRGYRTAYAEALLRAVGAASAAADAAGTTLLTPNGRAVGLAAGVSYMQQTVGQIAAPALGIKTDADHALRIDNQINAMKLQADLNATALVHAEDHAVRLTGEDMLSRHQDIPLLADYPAP